MAFSGNPNSAHQHQQSSMYQQQSSSHHLRGPPAMSFDTNPNSNMMYDYHATNNKMHRGSMNGLRQKLREAAGFPLREQHQNTGGNRNNNSNGMHSATGAGQYGNTSIGRGGGSGNGKDYRNNNINDPGFRGSHQRSSSYYNQDGGTNSSYGLHQPPPRFSHQSFPQSSMMAQYSQQPIMPRGNLYEPTMGPMMGPYSNMMMHQQQPMMYPQQYQSTLADPMMGMGMGMGMMGSSMPMPEPYLNPYQPMQPSMYNQHPMMMMSSSYNNYNPMGPMVPDQGMFPGTMPYGSYPSSYHSMPYNNRFSSGFW